MIRFLGVSFVSALFMFLLTGCSIDRVEIISHPSQTKPGDTIDVVFTSVYTYATNSSSSLFGTSRDSLHVLIGKPSEFEIVSLGYYKSDFSITNMLKDNTIPEEELAESLAVFASRQQRMSADNNLANAFSGRTVPAHNGDITEDINTDDIDQWSGFSSKIDINIPMMSQLDTALSLEAAMSTAQDAGFSFDSTMLDSLPVEVDTVGMTVYPIFLFARIATASVQGDFRLYYYGKTGPLPSPEVDTTSEIPDVDRGDMVFQPIVLSETSVLNSLFRGSQKSIRAYPNPFREKVQIDLGSLNTRDVKIEIYSVGGNLIRKLTPGKTSQMFWDGKDKSGTAVSPGAYLIRVIDGKNFLSRKVDYIK
ncbi:MAG: T9SS type A sorting domain-containing protein [Fibrobacter sp.]|nr:T9SS type A sorting domain-containing protein [Fibrobacter sp.]